MGGSSHGALLWTMFVDSLLTLSHTLSTMSEATGTSSASNEVCMVYSVNLCLRDYVVLSLPSGHFRVPIFSRAVAIPFDFLIASPTGSVVIHHY